MKYFLIIILILAVVFFVWQVVAFFKHDLPKIREKMKAKKMKKMVDNKSVDDTDRKE